MSGRGVPGILEKMKKIVAFGNPLLDTTVSIKDNTLLDKYNLKPDGQREITKDEMQHLSMDVIGFKQKKIAGGCAQNSLRVLQWLTNKQCDAFIFGSVGNDDEADLLNKSLHREGVKTRYVIQNDLPTGKTVALVNGPNRSLAAYLGAAEHLPLMDLLAQKDFYDLVKDSDFVYVEGFFLTQRIPTTEYILDFCNKNKKTVIFNISGEYVCNMYPDLVKYCVEKADIVFGNKGEFEALRIIMKFEDIDELMDHLIKNGKSKFPQYGNIYIITDGSEMGKCYYGSGKILNFVTPPIEPKDFKDTIGAGDAFTGGFIMGLCTNKSLEESLKIGCFAAYHIIQQMGCTIPKFTPTIENFI